MVSGVKKDIYFWNTEKIIAVLCFLLQYSLDEY